MEKGKKSDGEGTDARPEEVFDAKMHGAMEKLFQERLASISQDIPILQSSSSSSPNLPLVLYEPLGAIFVKLHELGKFHSIRSLATILTSSSIASSTISQPGTNGFILVMPNQVNMARSLTWYPKFDRRGNNDVKHHWYLYEVIWRARQTPNFGKLIEFQTTLRERAIRWFMKWSKIHQNPAIIDVKRDFIKDFKLPKKTSRVYQKCGKLSSEKEKLLGI